jgi:hypothetical protein
MFKGKKILFFSANFFGYQEEISAKLRFLGAEVDPFDERPKNSFLYKALIRLDKRLLKKRLDEYYENIISQCENKEYDFVFFLKAEAITQSKLRKLRKTQPNAIFILYMWDSIDNCPSVQNLFDLFDKIYSFDFTDVKAHSKLLFRPLFYLDDYSKLKNPDRNKHEISFIGTGHSDRYLIVSKIRRFCIENNFSHYFFVYLQDPKIYYARKLFSRSFKFAKKSDFSFIPLKKNDILKIIEESNCVLDIERPIQRGLTMRTIEVLGARKKLITTNKDIVNYDFFNKNNILVIDRDQPVIDIHFIRGEYQDLPDDIYQKYSIGNWLIEVFQ